MYITLKCIGGNKGLWWGWFLYYLHSITLGLTLIYYFLTNNKTRLCIGSWTWMWRNFQILCISWHKGLHCQASSRDVRHWQRRRSYASSWTTSSRKTRSWRTTCTTSCQQISSTSSQVWHVLDGSLGRTSKGSLASEYWQETTSFNWCCTECCGWSLGEQLSKLWRKNHGICRYVSCVHGMIFRNEKGLDM